MWFLGERIQPKRLLFFLYLIWNTNVNQNNEATSLTWQHKEYE